MVPWISSYSLLSKLKDGRVNGENLLLPIKCSESDFIFTIHFSYPLHSFFGLREAPKQRIEFSSN